MKVIVLLAILAVCSAQPGPGEPCKNATPPKIAETFESTTEVHRDDHGPGPSMRGEGVWDRNMETGDAMERVKFTFNSTRVEEEERLWRFEKHMEYFIFKNSTGVMCRSREMNENEKIPEVWAWLEKAHCMRRHDPRTNNTLDAWETHEGDESVTLFVSEENPDKPLGLIRRDRRGEEDVHFQTFVATAPPETVFELPEGVTCKPMRRQ